MVGSFQYVSLKNVSNNKFLGFQRELTATSPSAKPPCLFKLLQNGSGQYAFQHVKSTKFLSVDKEVTLETQDSNAWFDLSWLQGLITLSRVAPDRKPRYLATNAGPMTPAMDNGQASQWELIPMMHPVICWKIADHFCGLDNKGNLVSNLDSQFYKTSLIMTPAGKGQFTFRAENGKLINVESDGSVSANGNAANGQSCFVVEPWKKDPSAPEWNVSLKNVGSNKYITRVSQGLKCNGDTREKFSFSFLDSDGIVQLKDFKGKTLSTEGANLMSGRNVTGNEDQFIFEAFGEQLDQVAIRTSGKGGVYVSNKAGTLCTENTKTPSGGQLFQISFGPEGKIAFKNNSGKFLTSKAIGGLSWGASEPSETTYFEYQFINRRSFLPQDENFMFMGSSDKGQIKIVPTPEILTTEYIGNGNYTISNKDGKFMNFGQGKANWLTKAEATPVCIQFLRNKVGLKTADGFITPDIPAGTYVVRAQEYLYDF